MAVQASFHPPLARTLSHTGVTTFECSFGCTSAALASSRRIGAPKLHVWMPRKETILSTVKISSRLAPASSAARMYRRVPSGLRFVQAAFTAKHSKGLASRARRPAPQAGSHSRNCANALASQGPGAEVLLVATGQIQNYALMVVS